MGKENITMHFVCTHEDAWRLVKERSNFWVSNCGCRERRGKCDRSRIDLCLDFKETSSSGGSNTKKATLNDIALIFKEAKEKHLITRPFRNLKHPEEIDGICFCCDDCCEYFLNREEKCDKGIFQEKTDHDTCTDCGLCVDICHFDARMMESEIMKTCEEKCYGCGLCVDICPETCIDLVPRD